MGTEMKLKDMCEQLTKQFKILLHVDSTDRHLFDNPTKECKAINEILEAIGIRNLVDQVWEMSTEDIPINFIEIRPLPGHENDTLLLV